MSKPTESQIMPSAEHRADSVLLHGGVLLLLLLVISPLLTLTLRAFATFIPEKEFISISIVGLLFGTYIFFQRSGVNGFIVSLLVLLTFRINIPLGTRNELLGGIGPHIWLIHIPILGIIGVSVYENTRPEFSVPHLVYFGFVVWSLLAGVVSNGPRTDMALYFTLFVFQAGIIFLFTSWIVSSELISLVDSLKIFSLSIIGNSVIGLLQFVNRGPLGFPHHGEALREPVETLILGPLGTFPIGPHVNGFSLGGPLTILITLCFPIVLAFAFHEQRRRRLLLTTAAVFLIFVQRVTAWDAGRGGIIIGMITFVLLILYEHHDNIQMPILKQYTNYKSILLTVPLMIAIILVPSSKSGTATSLPTNTQSGTAFSVPLFDASNLGIRLQQYFLAICQTIENPLFGLGGANFPMVAAESFLGHDYWLHNMYLQVLVGTGIPGFFLYMTTVGLVIFTGIRLLQLPASDSIIVIGILAGLTGVLVQTNLNPEMNRMVSLFSLWAVSGLLVGEYHRLT